MTIATTQSSIILSASGTSYPFNFVSPNTSDISVIYTATSGLQTTLTVSQYSVVLNSVPTGGLWSTSGVVTTTTNYSSGTITIQRVLPYQQLTTISNQGDFLAQVVEEALDQLCMQVQQVANRTGSYRGVWSTGNYYNFGDIVQDGANGAYTNNIYVCSQANTSGVWATDEASGYWQLALNVQTLSATAGYLPLSGGTISGNLVVSGNEVIGQALTVTGSTYLAGLATCYNGLTVSSGSLTASGTVSGSGFTSLFASPPALGGTSPAAGAFTTLKTNGTQVIGIPSVTIYTSSSGTFTTPTNCRMLRVRGVGAGGGGGGSGSNAGTAGGAGGATTFGSSLLSGGGGGGGGTNSAGGTGGTSSLGAASGVALTGGSGGASPYTGGALTASGGGGNSAFGGASSGGNGAGIAGATNTGGGGSGGAGGGVFQGSGGGAGGYFEAWITSPASTYAYAVGAGGTAGGAGSSGYAGGAGGSGIIIIEAF